MTKWNRFENALAIRAGACNPSGIAYSLIEACQEARNQGVDLETDPAIKLIVSQLAYLAGIWDGISPWHRGDWESATDHCRAVVAQDEAQTTLGLLFPELSHE